MKPVAFDFHRATSLEDALQWLNDNPEGKVLAGGQSLVPMMNFRIARPNALIDINALQNLNFVEHIGDTLRIGALIHHEELANHAVVRDLCPVLAEAAGEVGHWAIRNRGTLGGSIAHADPAAELPTAMVALNATLTLSSVAGARKVPAAEFFLGFLTTDIQSNEIVTEVEIPLATGQSFGFAEYARRPGDFAVAGAFVSLHADGNGAVTWFGVGGGPEHRESNFPTDAASRASVIRDLVATLDVAEEDPYRTRLAASIAEKAYQNAQRRISQ